MAKCYVKAFFDWIEQTAALEDDERGRLFIAILEYARSGIAPDLAGREAILFPVFKSQIDRDLENSTAYAENGKKGGKVKTSNQTEPKRTKTNQSEPKPPNKEKAEDKEKDNDNDKDEEIKAASPPARAKSSNFDLFWQAYPKKVGKEAARKAFSRVKAPLESLLTAIERQKCGNQWLTENGRFIPNPATWLNQGRWEDDVTSVSPAAKPGYGVQGHHDPLNPLEEAAVNRLFEKPPKGADKMRHGVQAHGEELSAFQLAAIDKMLNEEADKNK